MRERLLTSLWMWWKLWSLSDKGIHRRNFVYNFSGFMNPVNYAFQVKNAEKWMAAKERAQSPCLTSRFWRKVDKRTIRAGVGCHAKGECMTPVPTGPRLWWEKLSEKAFCFLWDRCHQTRGSLLTAHCPALPSMLPPFPVGTTVRKRACGGQSYAELRLLSWFSWLLEFTYLIVRLCVLKYFLP